MEMESLLKALDGQYVLPGPGGDPIRNPGVLPSGKNIHALDPQAIPTRAAVAAAKGVVDKLIARQREEQGTWPETIACVLDADWDPVSLPWQKKTFHDEEGASRFGEAGRPNRAAPSSRQIQNDTQNDTQNNIRKITAQTHLEYGTKDAKEVK